MSMNDFIQDYLSDKDEGLKALVTFFLNLVMQPTIRSKNQIPTIIIQPKDLCTMSLKRKICP